MTVNHLDKVGGRAKKQNRLPQNGNSRAARARSTAFFCNDKFVWLTGYAQRSSDDWAGLGQAYPDWMHDYNASLIRGSHANYIRWMHIAPQRVDVSRVRQSRHR